MKILGHRTASHQRLSKFLWHAEQGIMWKCPRALETIKSEQQRRQERKALRVRIAERARRERVFEVPGRSQSTTRAIPSADMWRAFTDGSQTWEKSWTCPYDPDTRVVIQARFLISLARFLDMCISSHAYLLHFVGFSTPGLSKQLQHTVACRIISPFQRVYDSHPQIPTCCRWQLYLSTVGSRTSTLPA